MARNVKSTTLTTSIEIDGRMHTITLTLEGPDAGKGLANRMLVGAVSSMKPSFIDDLPKRVPPHSPERVARRM